MSIRLVIDTVADLTQKDLDDSVYILPIPVYIDGKEYLPFQNLQNDEFYQMQKEAKTLPRTSQVPYSILYNTFKEIIINGDEAIAIFMASKLSGSYSSSLAAIEQLKEEMGEDKVAKIYCLDSENVTYPLAALCFEAFRMIKDGKMSSKEIAERMRYLIKHIQMRAMIDDLTYLKMSGRVTGATAALAGLLSLKPIIKVEGGVIEATDKVRGIPKAFRRICETADKMNIDYSLPSYVGYTADLARGKMMMEAARRFTKLKPKTIISIGPTVGAHVGPGSAGLCWFVK